MTIRKITPSAAKKNPNAPVSMIVEIESPNGRAQQVRADSGNHFQSGSLGFIVNGK